LLDPIVASFMKSLTQKECLEIFEEADVTVGAVADIEQLSSHPYIIERGSLVNLPDRDVESGVLPAHAAIPRLSETPAKMRSEAPDIGENNEEIFREWYNLPLLEQMKKSPKNLILPHPRIQDRAFVLLPLLDIEPNWVHPILRKTAFQMYEELNEQVKNSIQLVQ